MRWEGSWSLGFQALQLGAQGLECRDLGLGVEGPEGFKGPGMFRLVFMVRKDLPFIGKKVKTYRVIGPARI